MPMTDGMIVEGTFALRTPRGSIALLSQSTQNSDVTNDDDSELKLTGSRTDLTSWEQNICSWSAIHSRL